MFRKVRPIPTSLDRLRHFLSKVRSRGALQTKKKISNALSRRTFHVAGRVGSTVTLRAGMTSRVMLLPRHPTTNRGTQTVVYCSNKRRTGSLRLLDRKYRLKLSTLDNYTARRTQLRFTKRGLIRQLQRPRSSIRTRYLAYARVRAVKQLRAVRRALSLRTRRQKSRLRFRYLPHYVYRKKKRRKALRSLLKKYRARIRKFHLKRTLNTTADVADFRRRSQRRLLRLRRIRSGRRGFTRRTIRRPWWGRALHRRRRRSRRFFAGLFGAKRWRRERRAKFVLKRARRNFDKTASMLQAVRTSSALLRRSALRHRRDAVNTQKLQVYPSTSAAALPTASLRIALRRLARQKRVRYTRKPKLTSYVSSGPLKFAAARVVLKGISNKMVTPPQKLFTRPRYRRWHATRPAQRQLVKQLRGAVAVSADATLTTAKSPRAAARFVLHHKGQLDNGQLEISRTVRNRFLSPAYGLALGGVVRYTAIKSRTRGGLFRTVRRGSRTHKIRAYGFLERMQQATLRLKTSSGVLQARAVLERKRLHYRELKFYHNRPRLRLRELAVTRNRKRKAGLVTFTRHSLGTARTLLAQSHALLPPTKAVNFVSRKRASAFSPAQNTLLSYRRHDDLLPIFWRRAHSRANIKAVNRIRRRRYGKRKRVLKKRSKIRTAIPRKALAATRKNFIIPSTQFRTIAQQRLNTGVAVRNAALLAANTAPNTVQVIKFSRRSRRKKAQKTQESRSGLTSIRRAIRYRRPQAARLKHILQTMSSKPTTLKRAHALWQVRSVQAMTGAERQLSAWSPQLSTRNRRQHYPRVRGVPLRRRYLGFKAKRERHLANVRRLARGIPQRRYVDYMPVKLQYFYGSAASAGYARFRRVHRMHSEHARWWRTLKQPVPFAHPYSRRDLNATRYQKLQYARALAPRTTDPQQLVRDHRGVSLHSKFPPRTIPWRNFHYPRPRRGAAPKLLQRWTFVTITGKTGRVAAPKAQLTVARSAREIRKLHRFVSRRGVWKNKRWAALDKNTLAASGHAQLQRCVALIPANTWHALRVKSGSPAVYAALKSQILNKLRRRISHQQAVSPTPSPEVAAATQQYLIGLLEAALSRHKIAAQSISAAEQHSALRANAFAARVARKAFTYLKVRELTSRGVLLSAGAMLRREHSRLYKHWLRGAEGTSKRSQVGYTPVSRSRYTDNVATTFGRRRTRFPASGRRKKSYDSLLHAFAKKVSPARFRRTSQLRFIRAVPALSSDFRENLAAFGPLHGMLRRRRIASQASAGAYLSAPWRELLVYRTQSGSQVTARKYNAKRRFMSLPSKLVFSKKQKEKRALLSPYKQPMYAARVGLLRRALRRRRRERTFIDLRRFAVQRRLPREKARRRRRDYRTLRRREAAKRGPYPAIRLRPMEPSLWALSHLSAVGPRLEIMARAPLAPVLSFGEIVSVNSSILRRDRKAVRGFVLPTYTKKTKRLKRQNRDTAKRKRRARRAKRASRRAAIRNTKHWSEKRDQRIRNTAFGHKKYWYARIVSSKLYARTAARTGAAASSLHRMRRTFGARRAAFNVRIAQLGATTTFSGVPACPGSTDLGRLSCLRRRSRVQQLGDKSSFDNLRVRSSEFTGRVSRIRQFSWNLARHREQTANSIPARLVAATTDLTSITPLWFQDPATRVVKTAAAKEQDELAAIAEKEERYQLTAQYVESVTSFIPELMNYLLSKKIENKAVNYRTAQQMVRNIYWSLRVYLNVDPFDTRFFLRDKTPAARLRLFEDISDWAKLQNTLQPKRAALRYRFQPSRLLRAPSTKRFRRDWLRAFFPDKHALYQESPEDYGHFLFRTHRIRRLRIGARGMDSWITTSRVVTDETRARQLLTLRSSKKRRRFETLLQTTRRLPAVEKAPWVSTSSSRMSFFGRDFSTFTGRGLSMTTRWVHRNKRFISLEEGWRTLSPLNQMNARNRALARIESLGKTSYIAAKTRYLGAPLLDTRFNRAKSPRSRQYLVRAPQKVLRPSKQFKLGELVTYRALVSGRGQSNEKAVHSWTRGTRQRHALAFSWKKRRAGLGAVRTKYSFRRHRDTVVTRTSSAGKVSQRGAYNFRRAAGRTNSLLHRKPLALLLGGILPTVNFSKMRRVQMLRNDRLRKRLAHKPRRYTALHPKRTSLPQKLRLVGANARTGLFKRSVRRDSQKRFPQYFRSELGRYVVRRHDVARAAGLFTRLRRQTPFDSHRPRLWNQLTLRWMKKYRIGRYWLRDTSRWLRDPWLSEIVAADMTLRRDRFGGELRSRTQQVGEYVAEVDAQGRDIPRKNAPRERHKFQKIMPTLPVIRDPEFKKTDRVLKRGPLSSKIVARHRLEIAGQARRKPVPSMRLANYEYRDVIREHKAEKAKSAKQRAEEEEARVQAYWARKAKKLPPKRPRRLPLKHPANLWLPHIIWKEIQRRIRKFEWRESDEVFFRRGFRTAFQFYPSERRRTPWLEPLMLTRATYSTRLREFRRRQYPHEQKKFKWLQRVRRLLYPARRARYIKRKRVWPKLRTYNQKLHYSLFKLRDRAAARRHFKRAVGRSRPAVSAFVAMSEGLTDRLDVTCLKMGFAPTIYWARIVSEFGLLKVNGVTIYDPSYQLKPADVIYPNWDTAARFQHYFTPQLRARLERRTAKESTAFYPTNMEYHRGTRAIVYKHAPDESDLRRSSRVRPTYFRWFKLDSV